MIKDVSIYVHIPFCNSKCYYCSFISSKQDSKTQDKYFKALKNEISDFESKNEYIVKTIYIGGGTPSCVDLKHIKTILNEIKKRFNVDKEVEITIECNPNSTTEEKLLFYKNIGINRISFGVQSFNKRSLDFIGRIQNDKKALKNYKKETIKILKKAKEFGFSNLSVDFILGLPYQTNFQLKKFIKQLSALVCHFSCYMLSIEENTKLAKLLPNGVSEEKVAKQYEIAVKTLAKLGFDRYEISNFAKKRFESKHNSVYWNMGEYIGFGISAHSFYDKKRVANTEKLKEYIDFYTEKQGNLAVKSIEKLTKEQLAEEMIMLALRTRKGLDLMKFKEKFYDLEIKKANIISLLLKSGFIKLENNFLFLTDKGYLVADKIILDLID
jgi:oxygen-independent coproporphyrinogen-3 oxidase